MGFITVPKLHMQIWGIWPPSLIKGEFRRQLYTVYKYFVLIYYMTFTFSLLIQIARLVLYHSSQSERISGSAALVVTILVLNTKATIYQKNHLPHMCLTFLDVEADVQESHDEEVQECYNNSFKWCRYLNTAIIISSNFTVWSFTAFFFYQMSIVGVENWDFDKTAFMYELYFPFNTTENFVGIAAFNVYAGFLGVILNVACQTVFYSLVMFTAMRFKILQIRLRKFDTFAKEFDGDMVLTIKKFIRDHQELDRFVRTLNEGTKYVILMEFVLNSVNVASVLFQLMAVRSLFELAFPAIYLSLLIMQVFVLGYTSNEIKFQSAKIADCICESPWQEQDELSKKLLYMMIMRAQKPLTLTIGPFNAMTAETALMTMKAAYSYVTLMMKSTGKEGLAT